MPIDWTIWEAIWKQQGVVVDRPRGTAHPRYRRLIYPCDDGYIPGTVGGDGAEVDVFVGSTRAGVVGAIFTQDPIKGDEEMKLLINLSPEEISQVHQFMESTGMTIILVLREGSDDSFGAVTCPMVEYPAHRGEGDPP